MTEVSAQTVLSPAAGEVQPTPQQAPQTAAATPAADNATPQNNNNPGATTEMQPGANGGVDLDNLDAAAYERLVAGLPGDDMVSPTGQNGAQVPPAASNAPAQAAAPAPQPVSPQAGDDEGMLPPGEIPNRYKVPTEGDPLTFHALRFYKESRAQNAGRPLSLVEADAMARQFLGMPAHAAAPAVVEEPAQQEQLLTAQPEPVQTTGRRREQLQAELTQLETDFETAANNYDAGEQARLIKEMNRVNREIAMAVTTEGQQEAQNMVQAAEAERVFLENWTAERDRTFAQFAHADAANPASAIHRLAVEIQERYENSQDPGQQAISRTPESVNWYFLQAARQLNIAPGNAAPAPATPPNSPRSTPLSAPAQTPIGAALLSGGNAGTQRAPNASGQALVDRIHSVHDLEQMISIMPGS